MPHFPFWAITSYFNPAKYKRRLQNYRVFRERLALPLIAVELSFDEEFELQPGDADVLIRLRGSDVMWQKERLLNLALTRLPRECEYVAWLDCDVVLSREDWPAAAMSELDKSALCQLFRTAHQLSRDAAGISKSLATSARESFGYACAAGIRSSVRASTADVGAYKRGYAWSCKRRLVERFGLYDRNVVGGGMAIGTAAIGRWEDIIAAAHMSPGHAADYRAWAEPFYEATNGRVGYIEGDLFHLWHGDLQDRHYEERHRILAEFAYDPAVDLTLDASGCWRWNSAKPEMHRQVRDYFTSRNEDGIALAQIR